MSALGMRHLATVWAWAKYLLVSHWVGDFALVLALDWVGDLGEWSLKSAAETPLVTDWADDFDL